jgi:glycosyltransferase involved in cell wall biosynthesis
MSRIKIIYYSHEVDYAGTWRSHERIIGSLNKDIFEPYVLYWDECPTNTRLDVVGKIVGEDHLISFKRSKEKTGSDLGYTPLWTDFHEKALIIKPDIIHMARSGYFEWPLNKRLARLQIETNIFAAMDISGFMDRSISLCQYNANIRKVSDVIIANPVPEAKLEGPNLRTEYNIPEDAIVCGRIGRPRGFDPIAITTFKRLVYSNPKVYYIVVAPCEEFKAAAQGVPNVILVPPTSDDTFISAFHRTLDIYLHYRVEGEIQSTAIAQAMMYGIPIISHISKFNNGQIETIADGGFVASDEEQYYQFLCYLVSNKEMRQEIGRKARLHALTTFEQETVVRKIEDCYIKWLHTLI